MNMIEATKLAFEKAFDYESRASRSEYWWYQLSYLIITIIAEVVGYALGLYEIIYYIAEVAFFVPAISLAVRRLHDIGMSGWWNLIALTIIGLIPLIIWYATPGHKGTNRFGTNPLEEENKQNWLANLREEIKQDNYDIENSLSISSNNHESDEFQNESIDFSEEGVYESAVGFSENMAECQYEQSLINSEEQEKEWTLSEEEWEEILLQREYEALSEIYDALGNDEEFLKEISRNDEFNERNTPFFIY